MKLNAYTFTHSVWPDALATEIAKTKPGIVKAPLDVMEGGGRVQTLNPAFLFNKRLHWVLCSVESHLLDWSNYGKKIKWKNLWPSRNWARAPSGVWGSDDLRIIPISDLSTTFLACKGKGGHKKEFKAPPPHDKARRKKKHRHIFKCSSCPDSDRDNQT